MPAPDVILFNPAFRVIDETPAWIVVDKPAHLLCHPTNPGNPPTLWDGLRGLLAYEIVNGARLSVITRLDRDTSGLVLVAKHPKSARVLSLAIQRGHIDKEYLALVWGWPAQDEWEVDAPILRRGEVEESRIWVKQMVHPGGRACRTGFRVERRWERAEGRFALVRCVPRSGRMHQIRVHLAHSGWPIVGDKIYGRDENCYLEFIETGWSDALRDRLLLDRHALHAWRLRWRGREWEAPLAPDLRVFLEGGESGGGKGTEACGSGAGASESRRDRLPEFAGPGSTTLNPMDTFNPVDPERFAAALARFDEENAKDPNLADGEGGAQPHELAYSHWLTAWVLRLEPAASEALRLAARCQHLRRWEIPRESYPATRAGYLKWRQKLKEFHAEKAAAILQETGYGEDLIGQVRDLNLKKNFPADPECRVLEDALCLVFLERQFAGLAAKATEEKVVSALRKCWDKMTPAARDLALQLDYGPGERRLLDLALGSSE